MNKQQTLKLAVIGASYLQLPLVRKAQEMGLEVHCFAWATDAVCKEVADYFYPVSVIEKEAILDVCKKIGINGICTIASDVAAPTVAYVANALGLHGNQYESALKANNKYMMRNSFLPAGVPCPQYRMVHSVDELDSSGMQFPLIVKPTDRSGSMGVSKVTNSTELETAVKDAIEVSFAGEAIVEEFIEGREISVEFISYNGHHYPLQITDKVTTLSPYFVELEHHQPSTLSKAFYDKIYEITSKALDALGITNGASHTEYKITDEGRIVIMETGARMGGDFIGSDLVQLSTGYDFLRGVIDVALGQFASPVIMSSSACSGVYFLCKQTERLMPVFKNPSAYPQIVACEITNEELKSVRRSADRSGYLIYKNKEKLIL